MSSSVNNAKLGSIPGFASGFAHDMPRIHGYSKQRCFGTRNWGAKGRSNVIGALLAHTMHTTWLCAFSIDTEIYSTWVGAELIPVLLPGSLVVESQQVVLG